MSRGPHFLHLYRPRADRLLEKGAVGEVEFSRGTYQVQVQLEGEESWVFLQLDETGEIKDNFCSCETFEEGTACLHSAMAYLYLLHGRRRPVHVRFFESLWYLLSHLAWSRGEALEDALKVFSSDMEARLQEWLDPDDEESEETSLKFSSASAEELALWKEGRPSAEFQYELSPWSDFAKSLMFAQEEGKAPTVRLKGPSQALPDAIEISGEGWTLDLAVDPGELEDLIPSFRGLLKDLQVVERDGGKVQSLVFEEKEGCLRIESQPSEGPARQGLPCGGWIYVPGEGFYLEGGGPAMPPKVPLRDLDSFLDEHRALVEQHLRGTRLHEEAPPLQYRVWLDDEQALNVETSLFTEGDLCQEGSHLLDHWAYVAGKGFYPVPDRRFDAPRVRIPVPEVSTFISQHRRWLNDQEGFEVHLAKVETRTSYQVSEDGSLAFRSWAVVGDETEGSIDYGDWVYLEGSGFFAKAAGAVNLLVPPGTKIVAEEVPAFIRKRRNELETLRGFFSERSPIAVAGLKLELKPTGDLLIEPESLLRPEYQNKEVRYFGDFVYVDGEGFHGVPLDKRIPERFRHPTKVPAEEVGLFVSYELDDLLPFASTLDPRLSLPKSVQLVVTKMEEKAQGKYFLELHYESEIGEVSFTEVQEAVKEGWQHWVSGAGVLNLSEDRFDWLRQLLMDHEDRDLEGVTLSTLELLRLHAFEDLKSAYRGEKIEVMDHLDALTRFSLPGMPSLSGLKSRPRPYQKVGIRWLWFLWRHGLSGLLCDDMGLGKTHQAMALMAALRKEIPKGRGRQVLPPIILVVCPTSVLYHWQEKLQAFLPSLRVYTFYGARRNLDALQKQNYDVLLTSYGVLRVDRDALSDFQFALAIYDEIQVAKNHQSRVHQALLSIEASMRLGLTGTPIENRLRELKALFDVVLPGYMPGHKHFREFFVKPIERDGDPGRKELLSRYIQPFILRRQKEDVLDDLPEKTEEIGHCELFPEQQRLYEEVLSQARDRLISELQNKDQPVPYIHIFALLTHLKQICNHPSVYYKDPLNYQQYSSGKWNLFKELLNEALDSEQKVVIFSQYLSMLDIFENYLHDLGVDYAIIKGSTRDRQRELKRFREDPQCRVFLGSLRAVGLGVDLTAASVVIHYDRWWNPAREDQATDRVHRIGQRRGVQVFKLVTRGTIEEAIDEIIARKGQLAEEILLKDDENLLKSLDRDELLYLLQFVPE